MKATELQLGDYVNYRGQIIKVTSLYDKGGSNEVGWGIKEDTWVNAINVEPILLTREILEKIGFVEKEFYSELIVGDFRIICDLHNVCIQHNEHVDLDIPIEYLHELQHAFRLCRISIKIGL